MLNENTPPLPPEEFLRRARAARTDRRALNPYPLLGATADAWPRGFPLEDVARCGATAFGAARRFDLIVCSWTLIHLADPLGTLEALGALLAPGGVLLANEACADVGSGGATLAAFVGCCRAAGLDVAVEGAELTYDDAHGFEHGGKSTARRARSSGRSSHPEF